MWIAKAPLVGVLDTNLKTFTDMVIQSKSGTGKTLVFGIIMLESLDLQVSTVQGLILAPTREIAFQNAHVIYTIGSELPGNQ